MTSKLKCPVCKEEIISDFCLMCDKIDKGYTSGRQIYKCNKCGLFGNKELWQALIQSQQDLEESQQATLQNAQTILEIHKDLEVARKALESISGVRGNIEDYYGGVSIHYQQMVLHMDEIATNALEQITHDNSEKPNSVEHKE